MERRQLTPGLPTFETGQRFLQIIDGVPVSHYKSMEKAIYEHIQNPQNPVNWKDPEAWIPQRLTGKDRELALKIWRGSGHLVNPRYTFEPMYLCKIHELFSIRDGVMHITERGARFVENDGGVLESIDEYEGLLLLLREIAEKGPGKRRDLMETFMAFCHGYTTLRANSSIDMVHAYDFRNLRQRQLIERTGHTYQITDAGLTYLQRIRGNDTQSSPAIEVLVSEKNAMAHQELTEYLKNMNPYSFEHLIKRLLEEMGYENVEVTAATNDKGVDVIGEIELGISRVREVIQVKRQQSNVGRGILDSLRGSLYRFDAVRGTIITTSGFSKGAQGEAFAKGQAPITLIDGERLISLLIEHNIGMRRREIRILEFDKEDLIQFESDSESDALSLPQSPDS
ncbi:MAG: restriction endonuclease [Chloroflexi bacterium]|nr:restriction endonuclease [Chloroflexota bacterium]